MKPGAHSHEDKLLEFAYGELPDPEARALQTHLSGCSRCTEALGAIRGVRQAVGKLQVEPAPEAGLDSLLAYAEQASRRMAAGPALRPVWWRRMVAPLAGVTALAVVGVVALQTSDQVDLKESLPFEAPAPVAALAPDPDGMERPPEASPAVEPTAPMADFGNAKFDTSPKKASKPIAQKQAMRRALNSKAMEMEEKTADAKKMPVMGGGAKDEAPADDFERDSAVVQAAAPSPPPQPTSAPSMGLSLGSGRTGGGYATSAPSAPSTRAAGSSRERSETLAGMSASSESLRLDSAGEGGQAVGELKGLLDQARRVSSSDRSEEIRLSQQVLGRGATGYQRLEALKRLCDAYESLGEPDRARNYCDLVLKEFPNTGAAKLVQQRRQQEGQGEYAKQKARAKQAEPAQAAPAEAKDAPAVSY